MGRKQFARVWRHAVAVAALVAVGGVAGCNPATLLWFMNRGDGKAPPKYPLAPKDDKAEVTVALLVTASPTLSVEFAGIHRELGDLLARKLEAETKDVKKPLKPIKVIEQAKVDRYLSANPNWKVTSPGNIAKGLGADYLIDLTVSQIGLYSAEYGREACAGSATIAGAVYDAESPDRVKWEYVHTSNPGPQGAGVMTAPVYRKWFVDRLASELAWRHAPHTSEMEIASRQQR